MRFQAALVLPALLLWGGCASERFYGGGGYSPGTPNVSLESATVTEDSPALGYPFVSFPLPVYPHDFARAGIESEVTVRLFIGKDGRVKDAKILKSHFRELADSVLTATSRWRFRETPERPPAEPKGLIVDCRIKFSIE